ncbi:MAG: RDD family protein [Bacillota bacterium]
MESRLIENSGFIRRGAAFLLDHTIIACLIGIVFDRAVENIWEVVNFFINITSLKFGLIIIIFILFFEIYFAIFEWLCKGCTPGKWFCGIKVVMDSGQEITFYAALIRNLLRCTYCIPPIFFVPDVVSFAISGENKRPGDYLAGTRVILKNTFEAITDQHTSTAGDMPETNDN